MHWGGGGKLAGICMAEPFNLSWKLIKTAVVTLMMAIIMTQCMVHHLLPEFARRFFISEWLEVYPYALVATYVTSLIAAPIGLAIEKRSLSVTAGNTV